MFVNVESPHLGAGYLKVVDHKLVFEEEHTDRQVVLADIRRGLRVLRRAPPITFTMDTGYNFRDAEDPMPEGEWITVVNGDAEVLGFRLLGDPGPAWHQVEAEIQSEARELSRVEETSAQTAPAAA